MVRLSDLKDLFYPKQFHDSIKIPFLDYRRTYLNHVHFMGRTAAGMIVLLSSVGLPHFHPVLQTCEFLISDGINELCFD